MSDMMTFPDTWEEFEKSYGFTDNEEVYTNGARLIPSFRVKQWLDHLPSVHPELSNNSPELDKEIGECNDCIKHGGDWEYDRVHCHKGDVPDTNVGELISRQDAIEGVKTLHDVAWKNWHEPTLSANVVLDMIRELPSVHPQWISCSERLPEEGTEVLGTDRDGCIRHVYKDKTGLYEFATVEEGMHIGIVAWMPLPDPYKEDKT